MTFRDPLQRIAVCRALLYAGRLGSLWTSEGPSEDVVAFVAGEHPGVLTAAEGALLHVVWVLWVGRPALARIPVHHLEPAMLHILAELVVACALGPAAVDDWLRAVTAVHAAA